MMNIICLIRKYFSSLYIIIFIIIIFSKSFINASSAKIINTNRNANKPMKKSSFAFHPLSIDLEYPFLLKNSKIKKMKKLLSNISFILERLIFTKNFKKKIQYNKNVLRRFKIKLTEKEEKVFEEKDIKADLLLIVKFISSRYSIVTHELYTKNDEDDNSESRRTYIALLKIKKDYDFSLYNSEDDFAIIIIREILKILGFRKDYLKQYFVRNNLDEVPTYLIENSEIFQSYKKYLNLTNRNFVGNKFTPETRFYKNFWDDNYYIHDIMSQTIYRDLAITELTISLMNEMYMYTINQCDIFKYRAGF